MNEIRYLLACALLPVVSRIESVFYSAHRALWKLENKIERAMWLHEGRGQ